MSPKTFLASLSLVMNKSSSTLMRVLQLPTYLSSVQAFFFGCPSSGTSSDVNLDGCFVLRVTNKHLRVSLFSPRIELP